MAIARCSLDCWYFPTEKLRNAPSVQDGIEHTKELGYRQQCANFIQDIGQRLTVSQLTINTAIVYMHRFYMFRSFQIFHRNVMAPCFLFLAAKVEEQPRKLEHVLKASHICLHKDEPPLDVKSDDYMRLSQELVNNESILLQTLGFDVTVEHPNTYVVKCAQLVKASKDLAQTAYLLATNSLHLTEFCVQFKPTVVACVCIYIACLWANYIIPESGDKKQWYELIDNAITEQQLVDLSSYFIKVLDSCPTRLRKRLQSGPVVCKDWKVLVKKETRDCTSINAASQSISSDIRHMNEASVSKSACLKLNPTNLPGAKSHLTALLKPHSHEATPPSQQWPGTLTTGQKSTRAEPSEGGRGGDLMKAQKRKADDQAQSAAENLEHEKDQRHRSQEDYQKLKDSMTKEKWEEFKKRQERKKLALKLHQEREVKRNTDEKDGLSASSNGSHKHMSRAPVPDGHYQHRLNQTLHGRTRKLSGSFHSTSSDSPAKRPKLDGDHQKSSSGDVKDYRLHGDSPNKVSANPLIKTLPSLLQSSSKVFSSTLPPPPLPPNIDELRALSFTSTENFLPSILFVPQLTDHVDELLSTSLNGFNSADSFFHPSGALLCPPPPPPSLPPQNPCR